jgi:hypothetical protein
MAKITNNSGISLPMAIWLAHDEYDHDPRENVISVTSLMRSTKELCLTKRVPEGTCLPDIADRLASRLGTSIHNSIEHSIVNNVAESLLALGYPKRAVERVRVNPTEPDEDCIDIYLEKRSEKTVGNFIVSGQFDIVFDGMVQDIKSTGTYTYENHTNDNAYILQLSLYRWLNPQIITNDHGAIQFLFKDWSKNKAMGKSGTYPKLPVLEYKIPLRPIGQMEQYVNQKLMDIEVCMDRPEHEMPACTAEERWATKPTIYKYYAKSDSVKASKVFKGGTSAQNKIEAERHYFTKGKGQIREFKDESTKCNYCSAASICIQRQGYVFDGSLKE